MLNAGTALLLDNPRFVAQLTQLERRVTRGGRDSIDHMRGAHDDLANAGMGALVHLPTSSLPSYETAHGQPPKAVMAYADLRLRYQARRHPVSLSQRRA